MPSLRKHGNVWYARIWIGTDPTTGRPIQRELSTGKTNKTEARDVASKLEADAAQGIVPSTERIAFSAYLERWLRDYGPRLAPSTLISYEQAIRNHVIPALGDVQLRALTPDMLARYYAAKMRDGRKDGKRGGLSASKVLYHHRILHRALDSAVKWGLVPRNVSEAVDAPRLRREERPILSREQAQELLDAVAADRLYGLYYVALSIGLREGELVALRWSDLDEAAGTLSVLRAMQRVRGQGLVFGPTKAKRPSSRVRLSPEALTALQRHREVQAAEKALAGSAYQDHGLIFCWPDGLPVDPLIVSKHFRRVRDRIGLPAGMHFHDLRHTSATLAAANGTPLKVIAERLGHRDESTTLRMYGHATSEMHEHWAGRMDDLLGPANSRAPEATRRHRVR